MNETTVATPSPSAAGTPLSQDPLALITVAGPDARTFLDSQLTRNVPSEGAALAGYCSPKGRLLATFVVWAAGDVVSLLLARDVAEATARRLRMYVLRAKAVVTLSTTAALERLVDRADLPPMPVWSTLATDGPTLIRYPDADGRSRHLRVWSSDPGAATGDVATWRWLDIRAGLPTIVTATQDRFVPQMVNLEALGGVDFKKGCFPGQEVVARSQYLGRLKRRMALASLPADEAMPAPGDDVFEVGSMEAVGLVVAAERGPDGRVALLAELPVAAFASSTLSLGEPARYALVVEPLPYPLPDNEVFVRPKL